MLQRIEATCAYLKSQTELRPEIAIILGTGLGGLTEEISVEKEIPYSQIPGFVQSTVAGHSGKLIFGTIAEVPVMAMQGRFHFYEGYPMKDVTYPEVVMKGMGIKYLMVSNAAGGLNPEFKAGDIMLITDHINLFPEHPLRGKNEDSIGTRFPDMNNAYNRDLIALAEKVAASNNIPYKKGVYVGTQGPTFETVAEYKYFRLIGGDTCGMSTVPEIIVAHWAGIKCFGVSIVSNALGDALNGIETNHEEVQRNTNIAKDNLKVLFREMVKAMQNL